jgi:hypothetical protein
MNSPPFDRVLMALPVRPALLHSEKYIVLYY